jgi:hypothetical protein
MTTLPKLALIPSGYKASKVYSALPTNGDGDFTFSRSGTATRVNKNGLIETVGSNVPRLDYSDSNCPSLLLERQRTNLITYSEDFTNWGDTGVTVTDNDAIAPTGAQTADLLTSSANNWRRALYLTLSNGSSYVFSCFVKKHTTTNKIRIQISIGASTSDLYFEFSTETLSASGGSLISLNVQNYPNDWYRISCEFQANGTNGGIFVYPSEYYNVPGSAYFWGVQLETGAALPTSYIPTNGQVGGVTRNADSCKLQPFNGLASDYPITVYGKIKIQEKFASFISIGNSANEFKYLYISTGTGNLTVSRRNATSDSDFYSFSYNIGDTIKFAIKYTSNSAYKLYVNGSLIANVTGGDDIDFDFDSVLLGQFRNSDLLRNSIYEAKIFNEALSDAELISLTT